MLYNIYTANDLGSAFCPEKTLGLEIVNCWMHKLNNFIDIFNEKIRKEVRLFQIWLNFVVKSSSKIPKTKFKFVMEPMILGNNTNRMALTYLSQCAVYHNLDSVKQWWQTNEPTSAAFLEFKHEETKVMFIANLSILLSEVYSVSMYIYIYYIFQSNRHNTLYLYIANI